MTNEFFKMILNNEKFKDLMINIKGITFNGQYLSFENFDFEKFLSENPNLLNNVDTLDSESIFKIIELHIKSEKMKNKNDEKESIQNIQEINPKIKNIKVVDVNEDNVNKRYIYYVDEYNKDHILYQYAPTDVLRVYKELLEEKQSEITEKDLFDALERRLQNLDLETLNQAKSRYDSSQRHINNLEFAERENNVNGLSENALANEEHNLIITGRTNEKNISNISITGDGSILRQKHEGGEFSEEKQDDKSMQQIGQDVQNENDIKDQISEKEEFDLPSVEEYESYILYSLELNENELKKRDEYENFAFDMMVYREYLTPELQQLLNRYYYLEQTVENIEEKTIEQEEFLNRFYEMVDREKNYQKDDVNEKVMRLKKQESNVTSSGFTYFSIFFIITILLEGMVALVAFGLLNK